MIKTKAIGVRLPIDLFKLVMSANPNKTFTAVVIDALLEKYAFIPSAQLLDDDVEDDGSVEDVVDRFLADLDSRKKFCGS